MRHESFTAHSIEEVAEIHSRETDSHDIEHFQLDRGPLTVGYEGFRFAESDAGDGSNRYPLHEVSRETCNRQVEVSGTSSPNATGIVMVLSDAPLRCNGVDVSRGNLFVVMPGDEVTYVAAAGVELLDFHWAPDIVADMLSRPEVKFKSTRVIAVPEDPWAAFERVILTRLAESRPCTNARVLGDELNAWIVESMTGIFGSLEPEARIDPSFHRATLYRTARDFMHETLDRSTTTTELCQVTGAKVRTLEVAFGEHLGISPVAYHHRIRMHAARADLAAADREAASVTQVALARGFAHLGRFSVDYRQLFGESPSATLVRAARRAA